MKEYSELYRQELLENIIPFWLSHSKDLENGGYYTCLDRFGKVYDTDKFIWLQGRQLWLFSMLCDKIERKEAWEEMAQHGASFLQKYGRDSHGHWYFSTDQYGAPLTQPHSIFSDCFAAMGFGALYKISPKEAYATIATSSFYNILSRRKDPKGIYNKLVPGTRDLKNFALPMILCNLSLELEHLLDKKVIDELIEEVVDEILHVFYDHHSGLILENVKVDGSLSDSHEGRLINPGHGIEAMWFLMDIGSRLKNRTVIEKALQIALQTIEFGWDKKFGGIYYFLDRLGKPPQQLEWDQKLWWVHMETLVCLAKGYALTGNEQAKQWFVKVHDYTWSHFRDESYQEWFGYLNRQGEVLLPLKGGKWKGCFHIPRALFQVWKALEHEEISVNGTHQLIGTNKINLR